MSWRVRDKVRALWAHLRDERSRPAELAAAVFVGVFFGVVPLYGIQTPLCLLAATVLRLNRLVAVAAAQISVPPLAPFLIAASVALGELLRFGRLRAPDVGEARGVLAGLSLLGGEIPDLFASAMLGGIALGAGLGAVAAGLTWWWATRRAPAEG